MTSDFNSNSNTSNMIYSGIKDAKIQQKPIGKILNKKSNGYYFYNKFTKKHRLFFSCGTLS